MIIITIVRNTEGPLAVLKG